MVEEVTVRLTNSGKEDGEEVAQLYVSLKDAKVKAPRYWH